MVLNWFTKNKNGKNDTQNSDENSDENSDVISNTDTSDATDKGLADTKSHADNTSDSDVENNTDIVTAHSKDTASTENAVDSGDTVDTASTASTENATDSENTADSANTENAEQDIAAETVETTEPETPEDSWFTRLMAGLSKSSSKLGDSIAGVFTKRKLDKDALQDLQDILIMADMGVQTSEKICEAIKEQRFEKEISDTEIRNLVAEQISLILEPVCVPLPKKDNGLQIIVMVGVNGAGKTTTIGKLAKQYADSGKSVLMAAGDTFRAAAVEQLQVWGQRVGCDVVTKDIGADAGALAYEAVEKALAGNYDTLFIDTAGRLHNKSTLMAELEKVMRVITKLVPDGADEVLLVLDGTVGQNALEQVKHFNEAVNVTGVVMTKLDGSAKGGVLVNVAQQHKLPIVAIGVGEGIADLNSFSAQQFSNSLLGL